MNHDPKDNPVIMQLHRRGSVRNFEERRIPDDIMRAVLEAGIHAPTGGNLQPYSIIKIENEDAKNKLGELAKGMKFLSRAPVNLLLCLDMHRLKRWAELEVAPFTATDSFRSFWISYQDAIIAAQNICTAADALGLGSVYIGMVLECFPEIIEMFKLPQGVFPVVLVAMGYPKKQPRVTNKLGLDVIVHDEKYREIGDDELLDAFHEKYEGKTRVMTEERIRDIYQVCLEAHGEEFAGKCEERIRRDGCISLAQLYFGLHYKANETTKGNATYLDLMERQGFGWLRERPRTKSR